MLIPNPSNILTDWSLLILSLPSQSATARMRIWRALKLLGCAALRDGAYLLPSGAAHRNALTEQANECQREGGTAWVMAVRGGTSDDPGAYPILFDRTEDYSALIRSWRQVASTLGSLGAAELVRLRRKLRREFEALQSIDFFPGDASADAQLAWLDLGKNFDRVLSPDEPQVTYGQIQRRDVQQFQSQVWATRRRLGVDRVASAWLILRFIDLQARFQWLAQPTDCPATAISFDFDGAIFSHVGEYVSFETLMMSFGLDGDPALARLALMIRSLDIGGESVPEAGGFEAVLAGARARLPDDDALLAEMSGVLDSLYSHFQRRKGPAPKAGTESS
jgi:hypothetical protein